jgi:[ribosomal protein S18]-alanine N-acetyltransferase
MELKIEPLSLEQAKIAFGWRYEGEYSVYNCPDWETLVKQGWAVTDDKKREDQYRSILNKQNELIGFFRLTPNGNVNIGLGLDPVKCGKGLGSDVMRLIVKCAEERYPGKELVLDVREFNIRAFRCYEKAGFKETERAYKETHMGGDVYVTMKYSPASSSSNV